MSDTRSSTSSTPSTPTAPTALGRIIRRVVPHPEAPAPLRGADGHGAPWPVESDTSRLDVAGTSTRHRVTGDGPPVLLLHGIGRSLSDWERQHDLLPGYRVHSVDLAGYGRTEPLTVPHTVPHLARFVADYLDAVGITEPAHVVGNSLGGAIALRLAVDEPDRVADLALASSAGFGKEVALAMRLLAVRPLTGLLLRPTPSSARHVEKSLFHDQTLVTPERVAYGHAIRQRPWMRQVLTETASSLGGFRGVHADWRDELLAAATALDLRVLAVWGEDDLILPARHMAEVARRFPEARTHLFGTCGHLPQIERAEEFAALLLDFWARKDAPANGTPGG